MEPQSQQTVSGDLDSELAASFQNSLAGSSPEMISAHK